jgi:hypothetical protein
MVPGWARTREEAGMIGQGADRPSGNTIRHTIYWIKPKTLERFTQKIRFMEKRFEKK